MSVAHVNLCYFKIQLIKHLQTLGLLYIKEPMARLFHRCVIFA